ncbi:unnamed protein product [Cladocopium goreaui]|uniref:Ankyrin-3 n=1 Tax=Cladocopium goreaui TaxID=2562237 RepID=A0A9P1FUD6_9DINO|nr:unnamed protein product [Cladocopium goreaui]
MERAHIREQLRVVLEQGEMMDVEGSRKFWFDRFNDEYITLESRNLFTRPEVQASLKYIPGLSASDACNPELLKPLADTTNDEVFHTHTVAALVQAAWMQTRLATAGEVLMSLLMLPLLCHASFTLRHEQPHFAVPPSLWIILCFHAKKSFEELMQHLAVCCYHRDRFNLFEFDNIADIAYIAAGWMAIVRQALDPTKLEKPWMSIFCAMAWLRALYSLRGETWMGPRLLPIISALKDTLAFFLVTWACILAAAHAYYNLQMREEPTPVYAALMQVVRLGIFGDFDLFEFEGLDTTYKPNGEEWEPVDPDPGPNYVNCQLSQQVFLRFETSIHVILVLTPRLDQLPVLESRMEG